MVGINELIDAEKVFADARKYFAYNLSQVGVEGNVVECGVYKGSSINHIAEIVGPNKPVYGFDSFDGLPEEWEIGENNTVKEGYFATKEMPKVKKNVELIKGWFKDTLPAWCGENPAPIAFLHLDCDIYSSTIEALTFLNHGLKRGSVIVFDDMYSWIEEDDYPYWRRGQWKAFREWLKEYSREVEVVSRMRRRKSCAVRVIK